MRDAKKLKIPSLLSEFGCGDGPEVFDEAEKYQQSWLCWHYKDYGKTWGSSLRGQENLGSGIYDEHGNPNNPLLRKLTRTYLQMVAGTLKHSNYEDTSKKFTALYSPKSGGKSILYISEKLNYPNGFSIEYFPSNANVFITKLEENYYQVIYAGPPNQEILIQVY